MRALFLACALLVHTATPASTFEDLLVVDCQGNLHGLASHEWETGLALPSHLLPQVYDWFVDGLRDRASCLCPSLSEIELDSLFLFTVGNVLQGLPDNANLVDLPADCEVEFSMNDVAKGTAIPLPPTCTYEKWQAGEQCNLAWKHESLGADLQLTLDHCPDSLFPFVSVSCAGPSCKDLLRPCRSDADCESGNTCQSLRYYYDYSRRMSGTIDHDNNRCHEGFYYDEISIVDLADNAREGWWDLMEGARVVEPNQMCPEWTRDPKDELLQYVMDAISAIQGGGADEMKFCSVDKIHLAYEDDALPTQPPVEWRDCNPLGDTTNRSCTEVCPIMEEDSEAYPSEDWARMYFSDLYWPTELGDTCEFIDSWDRFHDCYVGGNDPYEDCGVSFPDGCCCRDPDTYQQTCTTQDACHGECFGPRPVPVDTDYYYCETTPFEAWDGVLPSGESSSADSRKDGKAFRTFASSEFTPPSDSVSILHSTCDAQITLLAGTGMSVETVTGGHTQLFEEMTTMLKDMHDCRYRHSSPLTEEEQLFNFHGHRVAFWMNVMLRSISDAGEFLPPFETDTPLRALLEERDWWHWKEPDMPSSCDLRTWQSTGECKMAFGGFGELLNSDINIRVHIRDCDADRLPELGIDCQGKGCEEIFHIHHITHCLSDSDCDGRCVVPDFEDSFAIVLDGSPDYTGNGFMLDVSTDDVVNADELIEDLNEVIRFSMYDSVDGLPGDAVEQMLEVEHISPITSTLSMWLVDVSFIIPQNVSSITTASLASQLSNVLESYATLNNVSPTFTISGGDPVTDLSHVVVEPGQEITASFSFHTRPRYGIDESYEDTIREAIEDTVSTVVGTPSPVYAAMRALFDRTATASLFLMPGNHLPAANNADCDGVDPSQDVLCGCYRSDFCRGSVRELSYLLQNWDASELNYGYPYSTLSYSYVDVFYCRGTGFQREPCPDSCRNDNLFNLDLINLGLSVTEQPLWDYDSDIAHGLCEPAVVTRLSDEDIDVDAWVDKYLHTPDGLQTLNHLREMTDDVLPVLDDADEKPSGAAVLLPGVVVLATAVACIVW